MFLKALLLILFGVLFLIMTVVSLVFMVIGLANNKRNKFFWMGSFFVSLAICISCVVIFVRKTTQTVENYTNQFESAYVDQQLEHGMLGDNPVYKAGAEGNTQLDRIRAMVPDSLKNAVPSDFYEYLGYRDYYRMPLRYPYAIHCIDVFDQGYLFKEDKVTQFDRNDNGEQDMGISMIGSIAYDDKFLLIELAYQAGGTDQPAPEKYLLFEFDKEAKTSAKSLKKLLELAKRKGYKGPEELTPLEAYHKGFF